MQNKYEILAQDSIEKARSAMASLENINHSVSISGLSTIGAYVLGKANDFSTSPSVAAQSILKSAYTEFTVLVARLNAAKDDNWKLASAAQDLISDAAEQMGVGF